MTNERFKRHYQTAYKEAEKMAAALQKILYLTEDHKQSYKIAKKALDNWCKRRGGLPLL